MIHASSDLAELCRALEASFDKVTAGSQGPRARWRELVFVDSEVRISRFDVDAQPTQFHVLSREAITVLHVKRGRIDVRAGDQLHRVTDEGVALFPLDYETQFDVSRAEFDLLCVPLNAVARVFGLPQAALDLQHWHARPISDEFGEYLRRVAAFVMETASGLPLAYDHDLLRTHASDALVAAVIAAFDLTSRTDDGAERDAVIVRRALAAVHKRLTEPVSIPEIAAASGISVRRLQIAFRRQLGTSPLQHFRGIRLDAARAELKHNKYRRSITEVAHRYGYSNDGRFAKHYRERFGEFPSQTIRREGTSASAPGSLD